MLKSVILEEINEIELLKRTSQEIRNVNMDQSINEKVNDEIKKLCAEVEKKYNISHNSLFGLWQTTKDKKTTDKYNKLYGCNVTVISGITFLFDKGGVFGKLNDGVCPITDEDENLCKENGYSIMKGRLNDEQI